MRPRAASSRRAVPRVKPKRRRGRQRGRPTPADYRLVPALAAAKEIVRPALAHRRFELPVYAPAWLTPRGRYPRSTGVAPSPRLYVLTDRGGGRHRAYRLVVAEDETQGQYYGIEGTSWRSPPLLSGKHRSVRMAGRSYRVYYDGGHIRRVARLTERGAYWVSNTLSRDISNRRMLGIARSLTRIPR